MATSTFTIKQHDLEPSVVSYLLNSDGTAINLTTASAVYFIYRPVGGGSETRTAATVTSASTGKVTHTWSGSMTATVGSYYAEWEIMWPSTRPQTVPNSGYLSLVIEDDLDN